MQVGGDGGGVAKTGFPGHRGDVHQHAIGQRLGSRVGDRLPHRLLGLSILHRAGGRIAHPPSFRSRIGGSHPAMDRSPDGAAGASRGCSTPAPGISRRSMRCGNG